MSGQIPIFDTHQHLIFQDRFPYGWTDEVNVLAGSSFTLDNYREDASETAIRGTLFMEAGVDDAFIEQETAFALLLASREDTNIEGVVATCRPEQAEGFGDYLDLINHPRLVGLRRILHVVPNSLSRPTHFAENVRMLEARGLTFDLCVRPDQLWIARDLIDACPGVSFVLDHCGAPDIANGEFDAWRGGLLELGERPNLSCKVSALPTYCSAGGVSARTLRPYVEFAFETFGPERVLFGGDWPVCLIHSNLAQWVALLDEILEGSSEDELRAFYSGNAEKIYGVSAPV